MKLTKNFSLAEFTQSDTAERHGINNNPTTIHIENLRLLCVNVLQPLRDAIGPIRISSGYRSEALNNAVNGSKTSDHSHGRAADIKFYKDGETKNALLWDEILCNNLPFKQLIWEFGSDKEPRWVHVAHEVNKNKGQMLKAYKEQGKTKYKTLK
jgi:hypothetical protein